MPKGGLRPRSSDGSTDHLIKPKWRSGETKTIRVPVALTAQVLEIAHKLDEGELIDLSQDNKADSKPMTAVPPEALALLQNAITPKSKGGSYAANNATGIKRLVEQALALLQDEI